MSDVLIVARVRITIVVDGVLGLHIERARRRHHLIIHQLLVHLVLARDDLLVHLVEQFLVTIRGVLEHLGLLALVSVILLLLMLLKCVHLVFDLLSQLGIIDLTLSLKVEPCHARGHSIIANLLDEVFNLLEECLDLLSLANLVHLVLLLALVVRLQVFFAGFDQVKLDVQVEVVKIIFLTIDQIALVIDEVVSVDEVLITVVMDVHR